MKAFWFACITGFSSLALHPMTAKAADPVVLNAPGVNAWNVYGSAQFTNKLYKDSQVQGGGAVRIKITTATTNIWDVGMNTSIDKPIKAGDKIIVAIYAKSDEADQEIIPAAVNLNSAPYTQVVAGTFVLSKQWQLLHFEGIANSDYNPGQLIFSLSLGGQPKAVSFGPGFVLDQGQ